jgi:CDP-2,3-bis-(O-geranylgeranyl)-sn-glycerol synthase
MGFEIIIAQAFWLILPAYIANASAVLVGGGTPIDFGKNWKDGKRILGDGKTWRGLIIGTLVGMIGGFGLSVAAKYVAMTEFAYVGISDFYGFPLMVPIVFSICFGALLGDIIESFFKRRAGRKRGEDWIPFDQLDFILGVLFFSFLIAGLLQILGLTPGGENWFIKNFTIWHILFLLIVTPFFHLIANFIHRKAKTNSARK